MSTVTTYKQSSVNLSDICNTVDHSYYGDIQTNFTQNGVDIGNVLSLSTFSGVTGTIAPCGYTANITQYNTGLNWTVSNSVSGNWYSVSISSSGQYALACNGIHHYDSQNHG